MKILVLGGTGAMGKYLIPILNLSGNTVFVTSRSFHKDEENIRYIQGNAHEILFLERLLSQKWDCIVDFLVYNLDEFENRIGKILASTTQYVFLSSSRVYINTDDPINENTPRLLDVSEDKEFLSTNDYALRKARTEDILIKSASSFGNNYTIVRPYITFSDSRLQLGVMEKERWLFRALCGKSIVVNREMLKKRTTLTFGEDVAKAISVLIGNPDCLGQVYNITSSPSISWKEVLDIYLNVIYMKKRIRPRLCLFDDIEQLKHSSTYYAYIYDRLSNREFVNNKIINVDSAISFSNVKEKLTKCTESFLDNPEFLNINIASLAEDDRLAGEITKLKEIKGAKQKIRYLSLRFLPHSIISLIK